MQNLVTSCYTLMWWHYSIKYMYNVQVICEYACIYQVPINCKEHESKARQ